MMWWAINRKTRIKYGPYTEAERAAFEGTPSTNVYKWEAIPDIPAAPRPQAVKTAEENRAPERRKSKSNDDDGNKIGFGASVQARRGKPGRTDDRTHQ